MNPLWIPLIASVAALLVTIGVAWRRVTDRDERIEKLLDSRHFWFVRAKVVEGAMMDVERAIEGITKPKAEQPPAETSGGHDDD
jgi:hypothetical protein